MGLATRRLCPARPVFGGEGGALRHVRRAVLLTAGRKLLLAQWARHPLDVVAAGGGQRLLRLSRASLQVGLLQAVRVCEAGRLDQPPELLDCPGMGREPVSGRLGRYASPEFEGSALERELTSSGTPILDASSSASTSRPSTAADALAGADIRGICTQPTSSAIMMRHVHRMH